MRRQDDTPFDDTTVKTASLMTLFTMSTVLSAMLNLIAYGELTDGGAHAHALAFFVTTLTPPTLITGYAWWQERKGK